MINNATQVLTELHTRLAPLNGFIGLAPSDASYPLVTYTIISSNESPVKSFTTKGDVFTVQFSYFDDGSFIDCFGKAILVEAILEDMADVLRVSEGNLLMIENTEKSKLYQVIDTRTVELVKENSAIQPVAIDYLWIGGEGDGDMSNPLNYQPNGIPISIDTVTLDDNLLMFPNTGTVSCKQVIFDITLN